MPRMMILDTYYPEVLRELEYIRDMGVTYDESLKQILDVQFGTADFYSRHLRLLGWDVMDVIANCDWLQRLWATEHAPVTRDYILGWQIEEFKPDVLFLQSLGVLGRMLWDYSQWYVIAGQCSCALRADLVPYFDVIFTSFPHYAERPKFVYNPLAFEPDVLHDIPYDPFRHTKPIVFIGGVGGPSHWFSGMRLLETVAREFPDQFQWWGYGTETLPVSSALHGCYRGTAWGRKMYQIYADSNIVINRHGEIAGRYANNMRMYEATGCGALLLTEQRDNLYDLFSPDEVVAYESPEDAVRLIRHFLNHEPIRNRVAHKGQHRTVTDHTYAKRMKTVSDTLMGLL